MRQFFATGQRAVFLLIATSSHSGPENYLNTMIIRERQADRLTELKIHAKSWLTGPCLKFRYKTSDRVFPYLTQINILFKLQYA
jgi:hypothetical protein